MRFKQKVTLTQQLGLAYKSTAVVESEATSQ